MLQLALAFTGPCRLLHPIMPFVTEEAVAEAAEAPQSREQGVHHDLQLPSRPVSMEQC